MLARSAQGLYWMGRYVERAAFVCRLLQYQVSSLIDRPLEEIHAGWTLIFDCLKCQPPGGILESTGDDFTLADAFTLAGDLTFEQTNPSSIRTCLKYGRENARQMRHCISDVMWLNLNSQFLDFETKEMPEIWRTSPERFYSETEQHLTGIFGLANSSMYRDSAWRFIQLGRNIESIQFGAALLASHIADAELDRELKSRRMRTVLRVYKASQSYSRVKGHIVHEATAVEMLTTDRLLHSSLANRVVEVDDHILGIGPGHSGDCDLVRQSSGQLADMISRGWQRAAAKGEFLQRLELEARTLNDHIDSCYFSY